jgi:hypothetical protein
MLRRGERAEEGQSAVTQTCERLLCAYTSAHCHLAAAVVMAYDVLLLLDCVLLLSRDNWTNEHQREIVRLWVQA